MLTLDKIYHAAYVLKDVVRPTSLIRSKINPDCEMYLKTENLQITGSFKVRGAGYMISQLTEEEKARGVVACSAGNHAQGVALGTEFFHLAILTVKDLSDLNAGQVFRQEGIHIRAAIRYGSVGLPGELLEHIGE